MGTVDRRGFGDEAEGAAARYLEAQGYTLVERNYQCRQGELDIIAERGSLLCFVEVRMRSTAAWGDPSHTVSFAKQRRVVKAAVRYLHEQRVRDRDIRFDVISVLGRGPSAKVEHIPNAFDAGM
jgi:putative endonuclease